MNIPGQRATLKIGGKNVNDNIHHHVRLHYYGQKLEKHFRHHTSIPVQKAPEKDRVSIFKLIHDK